MKEPKHNYSIDLLGSDEQARRIGPIKEAMRAAGIRHCLIYDNANIYYLTGRVFRGYVYINTDLEAPLYFVRRPNHLTAGAGGGAVHYIRKPEEIRGILEQAGIDPDAPVGLELGKNAYSEVMRLAAVFGGQTADVTAIMRARRAVKTDAEIDAIRRSGVRQSLVYERIPHLYREGMTDIEFQIEIERASRLAGCLGQFRVSGTDMELFMGNVLTGENADCPSPYDFAMGGEGLAPSIPVGANGTVIGENSPVMVDVNGNYDGYMTDMTRMYVAGTASDTVLKLNDLSRRICDALASMMRPGAAAADLYARAASMAAEAGMADYFMGHRYHAGFVGHGVGIEVNELPVLAPRSKDILQAGNVIAVEPKFVIPGVGAVGIENTYAVCDGRAAEKLTTASEAVVQLD